LPYPIPWTSVRYDLGSAREQVSAGEQQQELRQRAPQRPQATRWRHRNERRSKERNAVATAVRRTASTERRNGHGCTAHGTVEVQHRDDGRQREAQTLTDADVRHTASMDCATPRRRNGRQPRSRPCQEDQITNTRAATNTLFTININNHNTTPTFALLRAAFIITIATQIANAKPTAILPCYASA
jgi:hypothetical protein